MNLEFRDLTIKEKFSIKESLILHHNQIIFYII